MRALILAALLALGPPAPDAGGGGSQPVRGPEPRGPAWLRDCLVYYHSGSSREKADVQAPGIAMAADPAMAVDPDGLFGSGLWTNKPLVIHGDALSPHRPLTLAFWWKLRKDMPIDGGFDLFTFQGRGIVSAFVRGKGEWCALKRPAGVLQVYYFPGIQNVNGIYDFDLAAHLDLHAGVWHQTVAVIRRATFVQLYTDGRPVAEAETSGREFLQADGVNVLSLGGGIVLDEIVLLDRAIDPGQVADWYRGVARLKDYWADGTSP